MKKYIPIIILLAALIAPAAAYAQTVPNLPRTTRARGECQVITVGNPPQTGVAFMYYDLTSLSNWSGTCVVPNRVLTGTSCAITLDASTAPAQFKTPTTEGQWLVWDVRGRVAKPDTCITRN